MEMAITHSAWAHFVVFTASAATESIFVSGSASIRSFGRHTICGTLFHGDDPTIRKFFAIFLTMYLIKVHAKTAKSVGWKLAQFLLQTLTHTETWKMKEKRSGIVICDVRHLNKTTNLSNSGPVLLDSREVTPVQQSQTSLRELIAERDGVSLIERSTVPIAVRNLLFQACTSGDCAENKKIQKTVSKTASIAKSVPRRL